MREDNTMASDYERRRALEDKLFGGAATAREKAEKAAREQLAAQRRAQADKDIAQGQAQRARLAKASARMDELQKKKR